MNGAPVLVQVDLYEGTTAANAVLKASDSVNIYAVQDGSDSITGFLTNAAHVVSADEDGNVSSFAGAGGTFRVFLGSTNITTSCTFSLSSGNSSNFSINQSTGVYSVSGMSGDQETATFQAVIPASLLPGTSDITITADYSISKSKTGAEGADGISGIFSGLGTYVKQADGYWDIADFTVSVDVQGLTNISYSSWSASGQNWSITSSNASSQTMSGPSNQPEGNVDGYVANGRSVSVTVTGTDSAGNTGVSKTLSGIIPIAREGLQGDEALREVSTLMYYTAGVSPIGGTYTPPTAPSDVSGAAGQNDAVFDFDSFSFTANAPSGWSFSAPTFTPLDGNGDFYKYYAVSVVFKEAGSGTPVVATGDTDGTGGSIDFGTVTETIGFTGLVTFSGKELIWDATGGSFNYTAIDGSGITTGTVSVPNL